MQLLRHDFSCGVVNVKRIAKNLPQFFSYPRQELRLKHLVALTVPCKEIELVYFCMCFHIVLV